MYLCFFKSSINNLMICLFIDYVDEKLPNKIKTAIRMEIIKDISEYDENGYIYIYKGVY